MCASATAASASTVRRGTCRHVASELLHALAASPTALGADGTARFHALPAGAYEVVDANGGRV